MSTVYGTFPAICTHRQAYRLSLWQRFMHKTAGVRRSLCGPNWMLGYASLVVQVASITFIVVLDAHGFSAAQMMILKSLEKWLIDLPMHNLTLYLSRRGLHHAS